MSGIYRHIRSDLRRILLTTPGLPQIAWEGRTFKPSSVLPYVREQLDPVYATTETLGIVGKTEERFIYALDVYYPQEASGSGTFISDAEDLADALRTTFHAGRGVGWVDPPMNGTILSSERRPIVEGGVFHQIPVRITGYVRRQTIPA